MPCVKPPPRTWRRTGNALLRIASDSACRVDLFDKPKVNWINCVRGGRRSSLQAQGDFCGTAIVLLAPFTSMYDIASHMVVWPITALLRERFDNLQALTTLAQRPVPPAVTIVHGDADEIVPVAMGRALAQSFPAMVTYHELPGATHNILERAAPLLVQTVEGRAD